MDLNMILSLCFFFEHVCDAIQKQYVICVSPLVTGGGILLQKEAGTFDTDCNLRDSLQVKVVNMYGKCPPMASVVCDM